MRGEGGFPINKINKSQETCLSVEAPRSSCLEVRSPSRFNEGLQATKGRLHESDPLPFGNGCGKQGACA